MSHKSINVCLLITCLLTLLACTKERNPLPNGLIGSWTTDEPAYQNRAVRLEKDFVIVGFGEDVTPTIQKITRVDTLTIETGIACTIYSTDKEGPHQLTVYFNPKEPASLFLKNVPGKWHRS